MTEPQSNNFILFYAQEIIINSVDCVFSRNECDLINNAMLVVTWSNIIAYEENHYGSTKKKTNSGSVKWIEYVPSQHTVVCPMCQC